MVHKNTLTGKAAHLAGAAVRDAGGVIKDKAVAGVSAVAGAAMAIPGTIGSYAGALNPIASLNIFRAGEYKYNEERLQLLSAGPKEALLDAYNSALGIPEPDAFEKRIELYLGEQQTALNQQLLDKHPLPEEQGKKLKKLEALNTALRAELKNFTAKIKELPANTHAETLQGVAQEEQRTLFEALKLLKEQTREFTAGFNKASTTSTPPAPTPPGTSGAGGTGTAGATDTGTAGTVAGVAGASTVAAPAAGTTPAGSEDPGTATPTPEPSITGEGAQGLSKALTQMEKDLNKAAKTDDEAFDNLEKDLTDIITDMHRAAQLERARIPVLAALAANGRKQRRFMHTYNNMGNNTGLFKRLGPSSNGAHVLMTGEEQKKVDDLRAAMRKLDLSGQEQAKLDKAKESLQKAENGLKKATDDNDQIKIDEYEAKIKALNDEIAKYQTKIKSAAAELVGFDPGLTALSGKKIKIIANDQGIGFAMDFPRPIFDPGYYTSSQHNTKADLLSMADLVKQSGAKTIETTIKSSNPKMALRLAQEAWEAALQLGFKEEDITIFMNGTKFTKDNIKELYPDIDKQSGKETGKITPKQQRAQKYKQIADQERAKVEEKKAPDVQKQQRSFKTTMQTTRSALAAAAKDLGPAPATPAAPAPGAGG